MYFQLGYDNTSLAIKTLSHRGLKLYLFLAKNKDGEWYPLSQDNAENFTGMDENTYGKAVKELIEKGFLTETEKPSFFEAGKKAVKYYVFSVCPDMSTAEVSPANEGDIHTKNIIQATTVFLALYMSPMNEGETLTSDNSVLCSWLFGRGRMNQYRLVYMTKGGDVHNRPFPPSPFGYIQQ